MAVNKDRVLEHEADGIQEFDNPLPGWLMAILWGSMAFSILYLAYYALAFGPASMEAEYRLEGIRDRIALQAHFDANPVVPPTATELLAGAGNEAVVALGQTRFMKSCARCHGDVGQGYIGPNLADEFWLHGGKVLQIFNTLVKGVPGKGMAPWGRAIKPDELAALVSYIRSLQDSKPSEARAPEGQPFEPEPIPEL